MKELIRKILNEEVPTVVKRRLGEFENTFKHYRKSFIDYKIRNFKIYWNLIMETVSETLYHAWFINTVTEDDWDESEKFIQDYLTKKYYNKTEEMWEKKHHKRLNESENDEEDIQKNLRVIEKLISMFDYSEVCDMWVEYNSEDGDYEIRSKMSTKNHNTSALEKEFEFLENSIKYLGFTNSYVFRPYYVENCEDEVKFLNESEEKNQSLLSLIEQHGLYDFMSMTGLSLKEIYEKTGELPKEVFERYIKDFIDKEGYHQTNGDVQLGYAVEIQKNIQIEHFYMEGDKVTVEIRGYNDYNEQTDGYIESLSNLSDEEMLAIVKDMIFWSENS